MPLLAALREEGAEQKIFYSSAGDRISDGELVELKIFAYQLEEINFTD